MKINLNRKASIAPNRNLFKKIFAVVISFSLIVVSFIILTNITQETRQTVSVLRVRNNDLSANTVLTEKEIEAYDLISREYTDDMILAADKDKVIDKKTLYYLRKKSILYKDQLTDEISLKNEWLYELDDEHEVLTLPYNYLECGGDILMPGDRVRIRISYEVDKASDSDDSGYGVRYSANNKTYRTETLFDSIVVVDMLNSASHSVYEVYREVARLSEDKKQEVMKSSEFLKNIQPKALVLEANEEQIDNYSKYKGYGAQSLLITILSRSGSNIITDQLPTVQKEVESWLNN